jgi:hypothetical protein
VITAGTALGIGTAIGASTSHPVTVNTPAVTATTTPAASPSTSAPAPAPLVPSPNGTYQGACDYTLGGNPVGGTAVATGDVQVQNTGNIGTIVAVSISWPQQGYSPLRSHKTVKIAAGNSNDVQFNLPLSYDQLSNLQNWQDGHLGSDGCAYSATITGTFGSAS